MIIANTVIKAETNSMSKVACKIEANSVMFELLSSRLYQDKPLAVVRELSTNALDAQIENGNADIPFVVHLPTKLEPFFSIRDFGTGMTEETVMELYSTMGSSSKRESNLLNGALGVGSKSPFAYTQGGAFTLASFINGEKHIYSVYSDGGVPSIALLGKFGTDEQNGVEISVPVQMEDVSTFVSKASFIYSWFKVKPITNVRLEYLDLKKPVFQGTNWKIFPNGASSRLLMANVAYPIDARNYGLSLLGTNGLVIEAKTGEVQMAGSREGLSYTKETIDKLKEFENIINLELKQEIAKMLEASPNYLDVADAMSALPREILNTFSTLELPKFLHLSWSEVRISGGDYFNFREPKYYGTKFNKAVSISPKKLRSSTLIFEDTIASGSMILAHYSTTSKDVIGLQRKPDLTGTEKEVLEEEAKELFEKLGLPFLKSSELAVSLGLVQPKVKGQKRAPSVAKVQGTFNSIVYDPKKIMQFADSSTTTVCKSTNPIFIPMINVSEADKTWSNIIEGNSSSSALAKVYNALVLLNYPKEVTIIAVTKKDKGYTKNLEYYRDFLIREFKSHTLVDVYTKGRELLSHITISFGSWADTDEFPEDYRALATFAHSIDNTNWDSSYVRRTYNYLSSMGITIKKIEEDVPNEIKKAVQKYMPLLKTLSYKPSGQEAHVQFVRLVNIIDEHSKIKQNKRS